MQIFDDTRLCLTVLSVHLMLLQIMMLPTSLHFYLACIIDVKQWDIVPADGMVLLPNIVSVLFVTCTASLLSHVCAEIFAQNGVNIFGYNSPADWDEELFKPSKDVESQWTFDRNKLENRRFEFFVGGVMMRVGLCLFGPLHLAMGPTARGIFFFLKQTRRKSSSLEHLIDLLAFVVGKLYIAWKTQNKHLNN